MGKSHQEEAFFGYPALHSEVATFLKLQFQFLILNYLFSSPCTQDSDFNGPAYSYIILDSTFRHPEKHNYRSIMIIFLGFHAG
jgi:hypothetical protein